MPKRHILAIALLVGVPGLWAQPRPIEPGWNLFSKDQDVQLGKEAAAEIEKEVQVVNDSRLTEYVNNIGQITLAAHLQPPVSASCSLTTGDRDRQSTLALIDGHRAAFNAYICCNFIG